MKKSVFFGSFVLIAATASTSFAYYPANYFRCTADQLYGHPSQQATDPEGRQGYGRTVWAKAAFNFYKYGMGNDPALAGRFWQGWMSQEVADAAAPAYDIDLYPVYTDNSAAGIWKGPGPNRPSTTDIWYGTTYSTIRNRSFSLPAGAQADALCEAGCYSPEQEIRFGETFTPIAEAYELGQRKVTTLASDATFGALNFIANDIARWTVDIAPADQTIITLRMESGGELRVTTEHPVLTSEGVMKKAKELVVGESLVREDGSADPIVSTEQKTVFTKVYNLRPTTLDLTSNILVAQGYLNGSARYQSEYLKYLNRVLLRHKVPAELIPRSRAVAVREAGGGNTAAQLKETAGEPRRR